MSGRDIADTVKGWLHPAEGPMLHQYAALGAALGPLLEVGSYCGRSTCWIGDAAAEAGTVLFAVDHHRGSPEMAADRECHDPDVLDPATGRHDTLVHLRRTLERAGLEDVVIPIVASSQTIGPHWTTPVGFAFIDAAHDDAGVLYDARTWSQHVLPGGYLLFHDTPIPGISRALNSLDGFTLVDEVDSLKVLQR